MYASSRETLEAKVVVLGATGVGKTSVVIRYVQKTFSASSTSTIGASFMTKKLTVDDCHVRLQIWDTAGQERFRAMAPMYYRGAQAAILVYDITSEESFSDMNTWVEGIIFTQTHISTLTLRMNLRILLLSPKKPKLFFRAEKSNDGRYGHMYCR
ncbi:ras family-domain-containing protein [Zychaea mexicana]|uniref:ras family-domain-containing protein n=1 Tax=Zychaea mexicana TaxID=64656 RepID=UPI0022FE50AA|nr:ras family-domain-containing protein [Zychaea mexicana]KAI9494819.1 ras family-domain-containing protein [Zychaea mexicana]